MSTSISSFATPSPLTGGGAPAGQSPVQVGPLAGPGAQGGGPAAQSPMQVPMVPAAVQGASGGGALAQAAPAPAPASAPASAPAPAPDPAPAAAPAPVSGGGATNADIASILPALQQVVATLSALVTQLGSQAGAAQGQAGAAAVQGGGETAVAAESGTPQQAPSASGCGCGAAKGAAGGVAATAGAAPRPAGDAGDGQYSRPEERPPEAPRVPGSGDGKLNSDSLTVKGAKMTAEQKRLTEIVLRKGKEMGANQKVLETAVATMIQESVIKNDSSVDGKDHDSLGLFQQRPSAGWGTRQQISDPEYAARKFFEKAIPNDRKNPDQAKTRLAQSVQISAFPDAYAKWDKEAEKIVADYTG